VDRIVNAKAHDAEADTAQWEHEIDLLLYKLYGVTDAEVELVEREV
jgi:hypothetical protein